MKPNSLGDNEIFIHIATPFPVRAEVSVALTTELIGYLREALDLGSDVLIEIVELGVGSWHVRLRIAAELAAVATFALTLHQAIQTKEDNLSNLVAEVCHGAQNCAITIETAEAEWRIEQSKVVRSGPPVTFERVSRQLSADPNRGSVNPPMSNEVLWVAIEPRVVRGPGNYALGRGRVLPIRIYDFYVVELDGRGRVLGLFGREPALNQRMEFEYQEIGYSPTVDNLPVCEFKLAKLEGL